MCLGLKKFPSADDQERTGARLMARDTLFYSNYASIEQRELGYMQGIRVRGIAKE